MGLVETAIDIFSLLAMLLGLVVILSLLISALIIFIILLLLAYSFKTGNILFPNLLVTGIVFFESPIRVILRLLRVDDTRMDLLAIKLKNQAIYPMYRKVPFNKRAIFLPQCLRSVTCPATLTPEGIKCRGCGACGISDARKEAERLGYMFFVVPGSSFIMRMMQKYKPEAIIGVGCIYEVRDGQDMMHRHRVPAIGVMLNRSGCVSTQLDWDRLFEAMHAIDMPESAGKAGTPATDDTGNFSHPSK
ncbi:MAG: hypothetical protein A4E28_02643 [Methanocella sp. PtaU1.Bin125]|nr:MAG: hypothetical protein A4E28_02643 [Methanocella sp. PtaU1.Bin125]